MPSLRSLLLFCLAFGALGETLHAQSREQKVRGDKAKVEADGFWIYNKFAQAVADAKASGKPIVAVLRCIPCEECVKLDDELVDRDERLRPLLEKFVRVRIVSTNGLDLKTFQFDTDQSFAVFFLNADGTMYGRFGTRSDRTEWQGDVSVEGLAKALAGALELHANYPKNKEQLAAKRGPTPDFPVPETMPTLKGKYGPNLDYDGNVVRSCIHCHQIGDAQREFHLSKNGTLPPAVLFPFPHPKALGLILDPRERATVLQVEPGSLADKAGFQRGDALVSLENQPLLSIADVQWVLHHTPANGATLTAIVRRADGVTPLRLQLPSGWRQQDDISWRASTWGLRRVAVGGMSLRPLAAEDRQALKLDEKTLGLRVQHVGQYAPHDGAKRAGVLKDDVLVSFGGRTDLLRESDLLEYSLNQLKPGSEIEIAVLRDGKRLNFKLPAATR